MTRMSPPPAPALQFGPYTLDATQAQLTRDGTRIALRPKAFELLVVLANRPGQLVTKDELLDAVWGRRFITEGVIKSVVGELRTALDDDPKQPRWIETVPRRGYRFAGTVMPAGSSSTGAQPSAVRPDSAAHGPPDLSPAAGNLKAVLVPMIGRDADLEALARMLATQRLITIAGPSGIGKTRLATALAEAQQGAWPDGVWLVELAALASGETTAAALAGTVAQSLHVAGVLTDADSAGALCRALQPLALLLVLDNAEHLLDPLAPLLEDLLTQAPSVRAVVTSQEPLHIAGEHVYRLAPLALPAAADDADADRLMGSGAVRLFIDRVAARVPGFGLAPRQQHAVADICRALDGLPLALELAAARVPLLGVHGIADMLLGGDHGLRWQLLTHGSRNAAPRQRTLRDALTWSHDLLDDAQRTVFRRLGVFHGGCSLELAQAVCADDALDAWRVLDALQGLVEKSLVVVSAQQPPRFTLLESPRAYAIERLEAAGETRPTRRRHVQALRLYWQRADARALSEPVLPWLAQHLPELENLRAALRWATGDACGETDADAALALVVASSLVWHRAGLVFEGREACEAVRARAEATPDAALRRGFDVAVATLAAYGNAYPPAPALECARRAADAFEQAGDVVRAYFANYLVFQLSVRAQSPATRTAALARMGTLAQSGWSELLSRYERTAQGYENRLSGRADLYLDYCREELTRCRRLGALAEGWAAAQGLMLAEHDHGRIDEALAAGRSGLDEIRANGRLRQHAAFLALWTTMLAESGDGPGTRGALTEAMPVLRGTGTPWMAHVALTWLALLEGRAEASARLLGWQEAEQRARQDSVAPGSTIGRSLQLLQGRLEHLLGAPTLKRLRDEGAKLDADAAEQLALGQVPAGVRTRV